MNHTITDFADFLTLANSQTDPQRMLLVFARAELDINHSTTQADDFALGIGGHLATVMCVDKTLGELTCFADLVSESEQTGQAWSILFVAGLCGANGVVPSSEDANKPLDAMIAAINSGIVSPYAAFNRDGILIQLEAN